MSKKMLPTASTLMRALVVAAVLAGIVNTAVPLFGILSANTMGNVCPPSVDKVIFTVATLIGAAFVFATSQVIVWVVPASHVRAVFGWVITNGPLSALTLTFIPALLMPPPPA